MVDVEADREGVNQALARLLAWPDIARSPQLARFLAYIVERRLVGDAQSIKAYSIAVDVFGRPADFDPQADPIVRVQARRLRGLLDQYYRGPGAHEDLRIELPIGRYVPEFVEAASMPEPVIHNEGPGAAAAASVIHARPRGHITISWFVLLVLAIGAAALTYSLSTWEPRREQQIVAGGAMQMPRLQVMEFQNLTGDATITAAISALAIELVTGFAPFTNVDVSLGGRWEVASQADQRNDYRLTGVVRRDSTVEGSYQVSAILTDLLTNSIVWNSSLTATRNAFIGRGGADAVSLDLIMVLGGTRGPLHARAWEFLERSGIEGQENLYLCTVLYSMYRTTPSVGSAERLSSCIDALSDREEHRGIVLAARASLIAEGGLLSRLSAAEHTVRLQEASELLAEATRIAPTSFFVWEQRARLHEVIGKHDQAEADYGTALQLNPAGIDALAAHARHLALIGRLDEAIPLAQQAIDAVPLTRVPDWFFCVPAIAALRADAFSQALRHARDCARADAELGPVLALLAAEGAGDAPMVEQQLPRVLEVSNFRNFGIISQLRRRVADKVLLEQMQTGLVRAGVPSTSLMAAY